MFLIILNLKQLNKFKQSQKYYIKIKIKNKLNYSLFYYFFIFNYFIFEIKLNYLMGIGDWGLGIGDWGLGPIPNPQSPIHILNN